MLYNKFKTKTIQSSHFYSENLHFELLEEVPQSDFLNESDNCEPRED